MTDRFQQTIDETAARREAAANAIRRMRDAIERSRRLLRESDDHLRPSGGGGDGADATTAGAGRSAGS